MKVIHDESACRLPAYCERHYSPAELAELWNLSVDTLRRLFVNEPGVLQISNPKARKAKLHNNAHTGNGLPSAYIGN